MSRRLVLVLVLALAAAVLGADVGARTLVEHTLTDLRLDLALPQAGAPPASIRIDFATATAEGTPLTGTLDPQTLSAADYAELQDCFGRAQVAVGTLVDLTPATPQVTPTATRTGAP